MTKELKLIKFFVLTVGLGFVLMLMASTAFASHPGQNKNGVVPQGPHQTACNNEGRQGIDVAIINDGAVHCDGAGAPGHF